MSERVHYIDWLRVLAVLLLIPFHSARLFDVWETFYVKNAVTDVGLSVFIAFVDLWHMPLLFLLAGASSWFALKRRTSRQYMGERAKRLLVPFLFGVLVVVPPQTWFAAMTNRGYAGSLAEFWPSFYIPRGDLSGYYGTFTPAHLWFVLFLFLLSALALPAFLVLREGRGRDRLSRAASRATLPVLVAAPLVPLLVADAFPDIGGKNIVYYLVYFIAGYALAAEPSVVETLERYRWPLIAAGVAACVATLVTYPAADALPDASPLAIAHDVMRLGGGWLAVLGLLGLGKRHLDTDAPGLAYASEASYPFYILHQTVIVAIGFLVVQLPWTVMPKWLLLCVAALVTTLAMYELFVRRWAPVRFFFGMKPLVQRIAKEPLTAS